MADYTKTEPAFDFQKGDFIIINGRPKMTVGRERIKNWVQKILNTQKGRYKIYNGTGYGINIEDTFVGKNYNRDYIRSEVKREITEILTANEDIVSIDNFNMEVDGSMLTVYFTVNSVYGDINDVKGAI